MNPLTWKREHQLAGVAFCTAGALAGLLYAWVDSPFYRICRAPGGFADCNHMLLVWLTYPSQYWLFVLIGTAVPGLLFIGFLLMGMQARRPSR